MSKGQDRAERAYDIVLYGATGFVGELTARYLAETRDFAVLIHRPLPFVDQAETLGDRGARAAARCRRHQGRPVARATCLVLAPGSSAPPSRAFEAASGVPDLSAGGERAQQTRSAWVSALSSSWPHLVGADAPCFEPLRVSSHPRERGPAPATPRRNSP